MSQCPVPAVPAQVVTLMLGRVLSDTEVAEFRQNLEKTLGAPWRVRVMPC